MSPFSRLSRSGFAHCRQSFAAAGGLLFPRPLALIISYCGENATHFVSKTDFRRLKRRLDSHSIILLRILYKFSTRRNRTRERKNAKDASLQMPRSAAHGFPAARRNGPGAVAAFVRARRRFAAGRAGFSAPGRIANRRSLHHARHAGSGRTHPKSRRSG